MVRKLVKSLLEIDNSQPVRDTYPQSSDIRNEDNIVTVEQSFMTFAY